METQVTETKKKKSPVKFIIIPIILLLAIWFGYKKISFAMSHETTDNAQIETQITPVLPRVPGYVKSIAVKDYDSVRSGELLVELDDAELQSQLLEMEADYQQSVADLANAKAQLNNAVTSLSVDRGNIAISDVKREQALNDVNRNQRLLQDEAITRKQYEDSKYNLETAEKQLQNTRNDLTTASSRIDVLKSGIQKAEAALQVKKAKIDEQKLKISYTKVFAPQAGKIGKKNISEGQFVQAGTPLFSIVNDTTYWIVANFKETQIRKFHQGMPVEISLDAYPDVKLEGKIESLSEATGAKFSMLPPDNASGNFVKVTQRVPVKIAINNIQKYSNILRSGLSAFVSITTK
jgi:membrane fusion protein (multidrug efflux system)